MNSTDIDSPYEEAGSVFSSSTSKAAARRLRRTRQKLGAYRHDLLVAMRIVNSIEQETIQSEWENWLADENMRCEQVNLMLKEKAGVAEQSSKKGSASSQQQQKVMRDVDETRIEALKVWHQDYCGSCQADQARLLEERRAKMVGM